MEDQQRKEYCRFCLIKFDRRFMIQLFNNNTHRLEQQIRDVLLSIEMSPTDQFSNCICIECAMKVSSCFNFMQFCYDNQKLLRSPLFNENLLVQSMDFPADPPIPADLSYLERQIVNTSPAHDVSIRSDKSPQSSPPQPNPMTTSKEVGERQRTTTTGPPSQTEELIDEDEEEEEDNPMAISTMVECHLEDEEEPLHINSIPPEVVGALPPQALHQPNPYRCSVCFREFAKKANVLSHFQTQHTNLEVPSAWKYEIDPAKCPICGDLVECLFAHMEYHAGKRTFKCQSCEWAFYSKNYLTIHAAKLHKGDAAIDARPDRFACKLCPPGKVCQNYDDLVAHYRQWHLNEMKNKLETCQLCGRETRYMKVHLQKHHNDNCPFKCPLCDKSYAKERYLHAHFTAAHADKQQQLQQLEHLKQSQSRGGQILKQALQTVPMDFSHSSNATAPPPPPPKETKKQQRTNTGGPLVQCVKCHMQFPNNRMLNMHINRYHNSNINHPGPAPTIMSEVSVTAVPAGPAKEPKRTGTKRRRDSTPKDVWNSSLSGMLVNMFGGQGYEM